MTNWCLIAVNNCKRQPTDDVTVSVTMTLIIVALPNKRCLENSFIHWSGQEAFIRLVLRSMNARFNEEKKRRQRKKQAAVQDGLKPKNAAMTSF